MLLYDIEIENAIPPRDGKREPGINYCAGWSDYAAMGIAVLCCYDYSSDRVRVFEQDNLAEFFALVGDAETVIGFNNHRFDNRILAENGCYVPPTKSYDILEEVWRGLGLPLQYRWETHGGINLGALCQANFRCGKSGNGAVAPIQWQRGQRGSVIDYCLSDVMLTKKLLDRILRAGRLRDPRQRENYFRVRKPQTDEG